MKLMSQARFEPPVMLSAKSYHFVVAERGTDLFFLEAMVRCRTMVLLTADMNSPSACGVQKWFGCDRSALQTGGRQHRAARRHSFGSQYAAMRGFETLRKLRQAEALSLVPITILTSSSAPSDRHRAVAEGGPVRSEKVEPAGFSRLIMSLLRRCGGAFPPSR